MKITNTLNTINTVLPCITLGTLLAAFALVSNQQHQQAEQTERFFTSLAQEQRNTIAYVQQIDSQQASQQVRITRIEGDLCRDDIQKTFIQCPL